MFLQDLQSFLLPDLMWLLTSRSRCSPVYLVSFKVYAPSWLCETKRSVSWWNQSLCVLFPVFVVSSWSSSLSQAYVAVKLYIFKLPNTVNASWTLSKASSFFSSVNKQNILKVHLFGFSRLFEHITWSSSETHRYNSCTLNYLIKVWYRMIVYNTYLKCCNSTINGWNQSLNYTSIATPVAPTPYTVMRKYNSSV